jgi:DNA-binding MarR family transcriptional regulator
MTADMAKIAPKPLFMSDIHTSPPVVKVAGRGEPAAEPEIEPGAVARPELPAGRHDLRILQSIRRIIRSAGLYSHRLAAVHGVTVPQLLCLMKVHERGPLTIKAMSGEVFLSPSTLVGIVDRLEAKGLVERRRSTVDRRQVQISCTEAGRGLIALSPSPLQESLAESVKRLPEAEAAALAHSIERIVELMEIQSIDAAPILETEPLLDAQESSPLRFPSSEF